MAKDITINGASFTEVPAIIVPKTGGGSATFRDMDTPLAWMGTGAEYVGEVYSHDYTLDQTNYNGWTPSTTAKAIIAKAAGTKFTADMLNHEYLIRWRFDIDVALNSGATKKAQIERVSGSLWQSIHRRPYGFAGFEAENYNYNYCTSAITASSYFVYYNTSGTRTWTTGISYGFYAAIQSATLSSTSANSVTVTPQAPVINARCNNSYFAAARAAEVDQANTTIKIRGDVFKTDLAQSWVRHSYGDAIKVLNDGVDA